MAADAPHQARGIASSSGERVGAPNPGLNGGRGALHAEEVDEVGLIPAGDSCRVWTPRCTGLSASMKLRETWRSRAVFSGALSLRTRQTKGWIQGGTMNAMRNGGDRRRTPA